MQIKHLLVIYFKGLEVRKKIKDKNPKHYKIINNKMNKKILKKKINKMLILNKNNIYNSPKLERKI